MFKGNRKDFPIPHFIGFIGAGNMAQAIVAGMLYSGRFSPEQLCVSAPSENNFSFWINKGIKSTINNVDVAYSCDVIVLAVKPQYLDDVLSGLGSKLRVDTLYVSILAGITICSLTEKLMKHSGASPAYKDAWRIARVMPNTPLMVGAGISVYAVDKEINSKDCELIESMFSAGGICEKLPEKLINAVGALAGSGPAYVYLMIEALSDGGVKMGIPRALATKFACHTLAGASKMVQETGRHPGQLKDEVCSPGGSTIAAMHVLEQSGVRGALIGAVEAATKRSAELANS